MHVPRERLHSESSNTKAPLLMFSRYRFGLAGRLLLVALAFATPLFGYEIHRAATERQNAIVRARGDVLALAKTAALRQDESLQEAANLLRMLVRIPAVSEAVEGECHAILREIVNEHPSAARMSVLNAQGQLLCSSHDPRPGPLSFADRAWFQDAIAPDAPTVVTSELLVSRTTGVPVVIVAGRVPGSVATAAGPVCLSVDGGGVRAGLFSGGGRW